MQIHEYEERLRIAMLQSRLRLLSAQLHGMGPDG